MPDLIDVLTRLDYERRHLAADGEVVELLTSVTRLRTRDNLHFAVKYSSLTDDDADAVIAREIDHHGRLGVGFEWKLYAHDKPADLLERLSRRGFSIGPVEAVLVFDLAAQRDWIESTDTDCVIRVDRLAQLADFKMVLDEVFSHHNAVILAQLTEAVRSNSTQHSGYIAYIGTEPASVGRLYTHPGSCRHEAGRRASAPQATRATARAPTRRAATLLA